MKIERMITDITACLFCIQTIPVYDAVVVRSRLLVVFYVSL